MGELKIKNKFKENTYLLYSAIFLFLFIFSAYFYQERIHGADASSYLFNAINDSFFYTERSRFIIYLSQWLPLIGVWLGLSMKALLYLYAIGNVLFFYLLFNFCYFKYNDRFSGIGFILVQSLGVGHAYFLWSYGEMYYGIGLVILLHSILNHKATLSLFEIVLAALILFFLVFGHPLVYPVLALSLLILYISKSNKKTILSTIFSFIIIVLFKFFLLNSYDSSIASGASLSLIKSNLSLSSFQQMLKNNTLIFLSYTLLLIWNIKRPIIGAISLFLMILITFTIAIFQPLGGATAQYYLAYSGISILLLRQAYYHSKSIFARNILIFIGILIALIGQWQIHQLSNQYIPHRKNIKHIIRYAKETNEKSLVITSSNLYKYENMTWVSSGIYYETLLLSSMEAYPIEVHVFERVMKRIDLESTNKAETAGPTDPRIQQTVYDFSLSNRDTVSSYLQNNSYHSWNKEYFGGLEGTQAFFCNKDSINTKAYLLENLQVENTEYASPYLSLTLLNKGNQTIFSANNKNLSLRIISQEKMDIDTLIVPILLDIYTTMSEEIILEFSDYPSHISLELMHEGESISKFSL